MNDFWMRFLTNFIGINIIMGVILLLFFLLTKSFWLMAYLLVTVSVTVAITTSEKDGENG